MPQLSWSPRALRDLARVEVFLFDKDPDAAFRARQTIRTSIAILESFPRAGRHIKHLPGEFREWPIRFGAAGYIVLYRVETDDRLTIAAIRHMREDGFPDFD
jgi:plasmid stabilization system protein ParE